MKTDSINWRRVLAIAGTLLVVAAVVPFAVFAVPQVVGADHSYVVLSGSMEPAISPGDAVIVGSVNPDSVAVGDVITFHRTQNGIPTTHRVVEVLQGDNGLAFRTMGDANEDPDGAPVPAGNLVGRVAFTIPFIGYIIEAGKTPLGYALFIIVPFGLLFASEVYGVVKRRRERDTDARETPDGDADSPGVAVDDAPADAPEGFAVTGESLVAVAAVLAPATLYAAWVAYAVRTPWSFGALTAGVVALAFVGYVRYATSDAPALATHADGGLDTFVAGTYPEKSESVTLGSLTDLQSVADRTGGFVVHDADRDRYFVATEGTVYAYDDATPEALR